MKCQNPETSSLEDDSEKCPVQTVTGPQASDPFPEGGFQAWATVAGAFLMQICGFGYMSSFGVYQDFYVREYLVDSSPSAISWIGSVNSFLLISGGLIAGRLYDRGYCYSLLRGGSLLIIFSYFMLSLAKPNQYYQIFLSQGVCAGIGGGITYVPSAAIISQYFRRRRALVMMIVASGSSLGSVIHPLMLNHTLDRLGFGNAVRISAAMLAVLLVISACLMRTRFTPSVQGPAQSGDERTSRSIVRDMLKDKAYVAATVGIGIFAIGFYFPLFYIQLDATSHGLDKTFSFYAIVILNVCSTIGRVAPSLVEHRFGIANTITGGSFACSMIIFGMIGVKTVASVVVIASLYGFFVGSVVTLMGPLIITLTPNFSEIGMRMGVTFFFAGIGSLIGTPLSGALLTNDYLWWRPAVLAGTTCLVGTVSLSAMLVIVHQRQMKEDRKGLDEECEVESVVDERDSTTMDGHVRNSEGVSGVAS